MIFFELVKAYPEGSSSLSRMALTARQMGYQGIIVSNSDPLRISWLENAKNISGIDIIKGVEIDAPNPKVQKARIQSFRSRIPFIMIRPKNEEMIRAASQDPHIDLMILPCESNRPFGIAAARMAGENQIAVGFDLSILIQLDGSARIRWIENSRRAIKLARKFNLNFIITSGAKSHLDLKAPRDLAALAGLIGLSPSEARAAMQYPGRIAELNSRSWKSPGVEML